MLFLWGGGGTQMARANMRGVACFGEVLLALVTLTLTLTLTLTRVLLHIDHEQW
jgi:hypothetical protein